MGKPSQNISIVRLFPNMVTILGLCIGLSAIRFADKGQFELAVAFIIFASCIDGIDGFLARKLNATSDFGAQLDSLADFLNFGVAPPLVIYHWLSVNDWMPARGVAWAMVLFYVVCCAIRLARFNCELEVEDPETIPPYQKKFFTGIAAPAGAIFACGPIITTLAWEEQSPDFFEYINFVQNPYFVVIYVAVAAILMASRIPTVSFKHLSVPRKHVSLVLAFVGLFTIAAFTMPWIVVFFIGLWYYLGLPVSSINYLRQKAAYNQKNNATKKR